MGVQQDVNVGRKQRRIASNIVYNLFEESITISGDCYSTTLYLPTCKVKITFTYSNSSYFQRGDNTLKVEDGRIAYNDELKASAIINSSNLDSDIINNSNKIFSEIACEINYGWITYGIEGSTIKITITYDNYSLTIEITPNDGTISGYTLSTAENYATSGRWRDILKFGAVIESVSQAFRPLNLSNFRIN